MTVESMPPERNAPSGTSLRKRNRTASLKRSAEASPRRKAEPFRSAMSMLVFYINRAGRNLNAADRARLERAKHELRKVFGKVPSKRPSKPR